MEIPIDWALPQIITFMLVVARLSGLFLLAPVFSSRMIPVNIKILALLGLAFTMTPVMGIAPANISTSALDLTLLMGKEVVIGLALGYTVSLIFTAVQVGASFIDVAIGFSMANIIDPLNNTQASVLGSFYSMLATLTFLAVNGHHWMLAGFARSFDLVSVTAYPDFQATYANVFAVFSQIFLMGFQIAAPVMVTLILVDVMLGIIARVVPQMNVFFVGIPLKIGVGLAAVIIAMPTFTTFFEARISDIVTGASVLVSAEGVDADGRR